MMRFLPWVAFVAIALVGPTSAAFVWSAGERNEEIRFALLAEEAANRITGQVGRHMLVIEATAAMFEARRGSISRAEFASYFRNLNLLERTPGSVALGYSIFARRDERDALALAYAASYGEPLDIWPDRSEEFLVVAVLLESVEPGPRPAGGFNAYSDPTRRAAIDRAIADAAPRATAPLTLLRDSAEPQVGFVIYAPVYASAFGIAARDVTPRVPTGFVVAAFRTAELLRSAIDVSPRLPVHMSVSDAAAPNAPLFDYGEASDPRFGDSYRAEHRIDVAGQDWILTVRPTAGFRTSSAGPLALALGLVSVLLAAAAAAMLREQIRAHDAAAALAAATQRDLADKDLIVQEMKHRIKNAIARILAIARQTAAHADSLEGFAQSFTQRLQAMSNAQDVLTRSKWQRADLGELLTQELTQVFGSEFDASRVRGPAVDLDERTTQALGLIFHELATNTLKYGGGNNLGPRIDASWTLARREDCDWLHIDWIESGGDGIVAPDSTGFGTRLIDASVRHELGGTIEREYRPGGLRVHLGVPLRRVAAARAG